MANQLLYSLQTKLFRTQFPDQNLHMLATFLEEQRGSAEV